MELTIKEKFNRYILKVSQIRGSFYVLIRKPRGKILGDDLRFMIDNIKYISEKIYRNFAGYSKDFRYDLFPCFKLVESYSSYQYHFLVVKKEYKP